MSDPTLLEKLEAELALLLEWAQREYGAPHRTPTFILVAAMDEQKRLEKVITELKKQEIK